MRSQGNDILTFKWTGYEFSDEIDAFIISITAHNWNEFQNALKTYGTPALNFVYAEQQETLLTILQV
ncbi:MAG: penicillin acylase family protein [Ignavibacteria bacterium]|nr:penicillin acylase family protein [Ignavibacteria bacterium]